MVVVMWIILILATMYCFMPKKDKNLAAAVIACMLLMNPYQTADVANETTDMLFFQGAYVTIFFDIVMALGIMHRIILLDEKDSPRYKAFLEILLAVVLFFPLLGSIRQDMILTLPLAASILIFYFLEYDQKLSKVLKSRRCMVTVILIMVVVAAAFICYRRLSVMYWDDSKGSYLKMDKYSGLWYSIGQFVNNLTMIFGNVEGAVFLSFPGLLKPCEIPFLPGLKDDLVREKGFAGKRKIRAGPVRILDPRLLFRPAVDAVHPFRGFHAAP